MDRRLFIRNAFKGVAAVSAVAATGAALSADSNPRVKLRSNQVKLNRNLLKTNYKGRSFMVSRSQRAAFSRMSPRLRTRLRAPRKGERILSVRELNELNNAMNVMRKHKEKMTMSTIMCPW